MVKERVSLTLDSEVVEKLDRKLERDGMDNRSRAVETFLREYLEKEAVSTALVLGGGRNSGCLIQVNGKPVIEHTLDHLEDAGVERIFVSTADPEVRDRLKDRVEIIFEDHPLGTGGSLRDISSVVDDTLLVMNGDVLCEVDLDDMYRAHSDGDWIATVALTTVDETSSYGVVRMKGSQVVGFTEKPEESLSHLVNAGVYLLEPGFLKRIPGEEDRQEVDIESIFETVADEGLLNGYVYEGEWRDFG